MNAFDISSEKRFEAILFAKALNLILGCDQSQHHVTGFLDRCIEEEKARLTSMNHESTEYHRLQNEILTATIVRTCLKVAESLADEKRKSDTFGRYKAELATTWALMQSIKLN